MYCTFSAQENAPVSNCTICCNQIITFLIAFVNYCDLSFINLEALIILSPLWNTLFINYISFYKSIMLHKIVIYIQKR